MSDEVENKAGIRVLCAGCKKPIHIDRFVGVTMGKDGKEMFWCDSLLCNIELSEQMIAKKATMVIKKEK
jgi:hypothetical protein